MFKKRCFVVTGLVLVFFLVGLCDVLKAKGYLEPTKEIEAALASVQAAQNSVAKKDPVASVTSLDSAKANLLKVLPRDQLGKRIEVKKQECLPLLAKAKASILQQDFQDAARVLSELFPKLKSILTAINSQNVFRSDVDPGIANSFDGQ